MRIFKVLTGSNNDPMMKRASDEESPWRFELSRTLKENHNGDIIRIAVPPFGLPFSNIVATVSKQQINVYDTDSLAEGHLDLIAHYQGNGVSASNIDVLLVLAK